MGGRHAATTQGYLKKERKKENRPPKRGMGEEDRVPTCTSRILEGRSGAQQARKKENRHYKRGMELGERLASPSASRGKKGGERRFVLN